MSVVVGIKDGGRVVLAADSLLSYGSFASPHDSPKVFRLGPYAIGVCGDQVVLNALAHRFDPPTPPDDPDGNAAERFVVREFVPAYRERLREDGLLRTEDGVEGPGKDGDTGFLLAFGPHLFEVFPDFAVVRYPGEFAAIGSGAPYAYGAFAATEGVVSPLARRGVRGVHAAVRYDAGCGYPIRTVETDGPVG